MMNIRMTLLTVTIATLSMSQVWGQTDAAEETFDHSQHHDAKPPAAAAPMKTEDVMPTMDHSKMDHGAMSDMKSDMSGSTGAMQGMDHGDMNMQGGSAPSDARDPHAYSGGYTLESGPYARTGQRELRLADEHNFGALLIDRLERNFTHDGDSTAYDAQAWFGRDYDRLVVKAEGDIVQGNFQDARTELLWGHAIATFWNTQLGVRYDSGVSPDRGWLAFGAQGLAPYWFELDATAYLGDSGRTALRLEAVYDLLLSQKLILQPRVEINLYGKSDLARDIGSGLSEVQSGLRLRYEFTRQFAPYAGVEWAGKFGGTADFARAAGEKTNEVRWVIGVRFWF